MDSIGGFSNFVGNLAWGTSASHNVVLCHVRDLWPGNHRLNLTIELLENDGFIPAVLFDHFEIKPSSSTILDDAFLLLNSDHPAITYDEHWNRSAQTLPLGFRYTNTPGSIVAINFNGLPDALCFRRKNQTDYIAGTSLRWYNGWNNELSGKETTATWSIDGGQPTTFTIAGVTNPTYGGGFVDLQLDIRNLAPGPHHLEVIYGNVGRPLALDKLIIYNSLPDPTFKPPMTTSNPSLDLRPTGATDGGGRSGGRCAFSSYIAITHRRLSDDRHIFCRQDKHWRQYRYWCSHLWHYRLLLYLLAKTKAATQDAESSLPKRRHKPAHTPGFSNLGAMSTLYLAGFTK